MKTKIHIFKVKVHTFHMHTFAHAQLPNFFFFFHYYYNLSTFVYNEMKSSKQHVTSTQWVMDMLKTGTSTSVNRGIQIKNHICTFS